jgi:hypothetical protein
MLIIYVVIEDPSLTSIGLFLAPFYCSKYEVYFIPSKCMTESR